MDQWARAGRLLQFFPGDAPRRRTASRPSRRVPSRPAAMPVPSPIPVPAADAQAAALDMQARATVARLTGALSPMAGLLAAFDWA
ncbi:poly-beta-hydroxybutyrate polymerase N-terminal domain-containing protein, partial [Pseudacidovorax intermedius]|uniref:poly-beta-hydroxybutyrate polymerase N-terminal domain-containing protein n=1 Tax=Pseudacidovorax intermedius TaxID=433924 RepID=UPI0034DD4283